LGRYQWPASKRMVPGIYTARLGGQYTHHLSNLWSPAKVGYKDFSPCSGPNGPSPAAWAHLFKEAELNTSVPGGEQHDGFAMYDSGLIRLDVPQGPAT